MKYRKKPVVIEAEQYFFVGNPTPHPMVKQQLTSLGLRHYIPTLEGEMAVSEGDYIIKGVKGEFYPCKPDIFEMTYEAVP